MQAAPWWCQSGATSACACVTMSPPLRAWWRQRWHSWGCCSTKRCEQSTMLVFCIGNSIAACSYPLATLTLSKMLSLGNLRSYYPITFISTGACHRPLLRFPGRLAPRQTAPRPRADALSPGPGECSIHTHVCILLRQMFNTCQAATPRFPHSTYTLHTITHNPLPGVLLHVHAQAALLLPM